MSTLKRGIYTGSDYDKSYKVTDHFTYGEFVCKCCKSNHTHIEFIEKLEEARGYSNDIDNDIRYTILSGYRCPANNEFVDGVKDSAHTLGIAADIRFRNNHERYVILYGIFMAGFKRIGEGSGFFHVDIDEDKPQYTKWGY